MIIRIHTSLIHHFWVLIYSFLGNKVDSIEDVNKEKYLQNIVIELEFGYNKINSSES